MAIIISVLVILLVCVVLAVLRVYNQLILLQNNKDNALADMANSLEKLMGHIHTTSHKKASSAWNKASTPLEKVKAFNLLEPVLEKVATTKAHTYLVKTAAPRRYYNHTTKKLNARLKTFPSNLVGSFLGYDQEPLFILTEEEKVGESLDIKR